MLTSAHFYTLKSRLDDATSSQRSIATDAGLSVGAINSAIRELYDMELLDDKGAVTERGLSALVPYKVDNAVIMAAGLSSRFAPISYEKPKGLFKVRGEILVERQIRQLQEAGINDITLVVGYKKEEFFYLEDAMNVDIVVNPDYATRNNNSTIKCVSHKLANTYICSSDDYFTKNPFEKYVYAPYYSAVFEEGKTDEYCLSTKGKADLITGVTVGGVNSWVMMGHVYWDRAFSAQFLRILDAVYERPETVNKLWEDIYIDHIAQLRMNMRKYSRDVIWEFDNLDELRLFDPAFIDNVDSEILDNICHVLDCERSSISCITPLKKGLTNLSFKFNANDKCYVYRHPGEGTDAIINRSSEVESQKIAFDLGIDKTFIYEDPERGWKISRFVEDCENLDYHDWDQVTHAMQIARTLHDSHKSIPFEYDVFLNACSIIEKLNVQIRSSMKDFNQLKDMAEELHEMAQSHGARQCLCHCDFYSPNFLVKGTDIQLIDWEYSGMSDYAVDLGTFVCCCEDYSDKDVERVLNEYFGRKPTEEERFHCFSYVSLASYYWFVWALYKEQMGKPVGEYLLLWYRYAKRYGCESKKIAVKLGY